MDLATVLTGYESLWLYFLWGFLKDIYRNNLHRVEELKDKTTAVVENISDETLAGVMENFSRRLQMILDVQGTYTEYVFTWIINFHLSRVLWHQIHVSAIYQQVLVFKTTEYFLDGPVPSLRLCIGLFRLRWYSLTADQNYWCNNNSTTCICLRLTLRFLVFHQ
jgi:hypothetical protein